MSRYVVTLPPAFARDREGRELHVPGRWLSRGFLAVLSEAQCAELWSDADHYATGGLDEAPPGLALSARATLRALGRAGYRPLKK